MVPSPNGMGRDVGWNVTLRFCPDPIPIGHSVVKKVKPHQPRCREREDPLYFLFLQSTNKDFLLLAIWSRSHDLQARPVRSLFASGPQAIRISEANRDFCVA